ncbi:hypothetical protein S40285_03974 [Stachybotrys chlorohalonatus IBT 40285]|uniref:Uncharacterized protein n=1 Tax=Stachybotrys chlorohalonatus (strain IBT 40285) TaxID=1283841 RepID=A0A084QKY9_STAC4|nr:hypothetical protein S40285_03974 [Stachybotrys chlorohalonata IBT 40285]
MAALPGASANDPWSWLKRKRFTPMEHRNIDFEAAGQGHVALKAKRQAQGQTPRPVFSTPAAGPNGAPTPIANPALGPGNGAAGSTPGAAQGTPRPAASTPGPNRPVNTPANTPVAGAPANTPAAGAPANTPIPPGASRPVFSTLPPNDPANAPPAFLNRPVATPPVANTPLPNPAAPAATTPGFLGFITLVPAPTTFATIATSAPAPAPAPPAAPPVQPPPAAPSAAPSAAPVAPAEPPNPPAAPVASSAPPAVPISEDAVGNPTSGIPLPINGAPSATLPAERVAADPSNQNADDRSGGLPQPVQAGIALGTASVLAILLIIIIIIYKRKKNAMAQPYVRPVETPDPPQEKPLFTYNQAATIGQPQAGYNNMALPQGVYGSEKPANVQPYGTGNQTGAYPVQPVPAGGYGGDRRSGGSVRETYAGYSVYAAYSNNPEPRAAPMPPATLPAATYGGPSQPPAGYYQNGGNGYGQAGDGARPPFL